METKNEKEMEALKAEYAKEIERVQGITKEFFAEYAELCKKYSAQIVPKIISTPNNPTGFNIQLFLTPYKPSENEKDGQ